MGGEELVADPTLLDLWHLQDCLEEIVLKIQIKIIYDICIDIPKFGRSKKHKVAHLFVFVTLLSDFNAYTAFWSIVVCSSRIYENWTVKELYFVCFSTSFWKVFIFPQKIC